MILLKCLFIISDIREVKYKKFSCIVPLLEHHFNGIIQQFSILSHKVIPEYLYMIVIK